MHALRSRLAILLLLCFTRVLLPDTWVLAMHAHQHTTEEATQQPGAPKGKALLTAKHQHCAVDHFYDVPFQAASLLEFTLFTSYGVPAAEQGTSVWLAATRLTADLRGPPSQG
ncbi:hypothetical protein [Hymenobacter cellulosivorans]|uniref:Secreted protein n=1 Tax=Hymenobacter cellulosivorans TaxID=2932249 RepID=A0ABY4FDG4_9BACT|nr:hypothetical protein [Hymenobacter cellulosivorans]UOQ54440.1 hypothetical protein MUN80_06680 [Hymenobacter cellulosivorans]